MKLVFFSSDRSEVQQLSHEFVTTGIPCELRESFVSKDAVSNLPQAELWIQNDSDLSRAFMLCVERTIGFAKRQIESAETRDHNKAIAA